MKSKSLPLSQGAEEVHKTRQTPLSSDHHTETLMKPEQFDIEKRRKLWKRLGIGIGLFVFISLCALIPAIFWIPPVSEEMATSSFNEAKALWENSHGTFEENPYDGAPASEDNLYEIPEIAAILDGSYGDDDLNNLSVDELLEKQTGHPGPYSKEQYASLLTIYKSEFEALEDLKSGLRQRKAAFIPRPSVLSSDIPYISSTNYLRYFRLVTLRTELNAILGKRKACFDDLTALKKLAQARKGYFSSLLDIVREGYQTASTLSLCSKLVEQRPDWAPEIKAFLNDYPVLVEEDFLLALRRDYVAIFAVLRSSEGREFGSIGAEWQEEFFGEIDFLEPKPLSRDERIYYSSQLAIILHQKLFFPSSRREKDDTAMEAMLRRKLYPRAAPMLYIISSTNTYIESIEEIELKFKEAPLLIELIARQELGQELPEKLTDLEESSHGVSKTRLKEISYTKQPDGTFNLDLGYAPYWN